MFSWTAYLLLLFAILLGVVGQILLKQGMRKRPSFQLRQLISLITDWAVVGGFASYGLSTLIYLKSLEQLDLSLAYPTVSLGYVVVILASRWLFGEKVSWVRWTAVAIICLGVALVGIE
ncbi:MAG: SMR family transporter [Anaerolineae bacterium]